MLKIGDFSKLTQVSIKTLRYYGRLGLLKPAWINRYNGYRFYTIDQVGQLNRILAMKELGFSLDQVQALLCKDISVPELHGMLIMKKAELEEHIQQEQERLHLIKKRLHQLEEAQQPDYDVLLSGVIQTPKEMVNMEPRIVNKDTFKVIGMKVISKNENNEIPELWGKMEPHWPEIRNVLHPEKYYGVCGELKEDGRFLYLAGQEVEQTNDIPEGMEVYNVPAQTYAVFQCTIPTIGSTYEYAFKTWLPGSDYEHVPAPDFELYDEDFNPENSEVDPLYIYIPVQPKS